MTSRSVPRIAILHYAAPPVVGGVESTIDHHARELAAAGYAVDVIAGRGETFHPAVRFHHIPELDSRHPEVLEAGAALAAGSAGPGFEILRDRLADRLGELLAGVPVCIVHNALSLHKNLPLTAALRLLSDAGDVRLIAWCHDFAWLDELYTPDLHPGYPWDLLRTPWPGVRYVAVSAHRHRRLAELFGLPEDEVTVVTPGVDAFEFLALPSPVRALAERLDLLAADPLILLPARITRRKNIELAVRVTAALLDRTPRPVLLVTGPPGPHNPANAAYLDSLRDLRRDMGVEGQVHFVYEQGEPGRPLHLPDEAIAGLYRLADLMLFPSLREGFGIPVLEAGLARLPVFAADIPPVRESAGEFATLFDPRSKPTAIASEIADFLARDRRHALRKRVLRRFTWRRIVQYEMIPLIESVTP
ncbi:MAG TPA: glycosyltransferase family 4 protein [Anaerolineales bacterium]|nr:glycosyltransferase family 4 protein [Anaerolineales bacterium]